MRDYTDYFFLSLCLISSLPPLLSPSYPISPPSLSFFLPSFFKKIFLFKIYMYGHFACTSYVQGPRNLEKGIGPLELELQVTMGCHVGAKN